MNTSKLKRKDVTKALRKCCSAVIAPCNRSEPESCPFEVEGRFKCGVDLIIEPDDGIDFGSYEETFLAMASIEHMVEK